MDTTLENHIEQVYTEIDGINISNGLQSFIQLIFLPVFIISATIGLLLGVILGGILSYFLAVLDFTVGGDIMEKINSGIILLSIFFILDKTNRAIQKIDPLFFIRLQLRGFFYNYKLIKEKNNYTIDELLKESQSIYQYQKIIIFLGKIPFIFTKGSYQKILDIITLSNTLILMILEHLKIILLHNLEEETNTIYQGRKDLENISKIGGLDDVSTLQRTRFDDQIRQFEELQRVLVKV